MKPSLLLLFLFFLTSFTTALISTTSTPPHLRQPHFFKHSKLHQNTSQPQLYFEVTQPLPTDILTPSCTLPILQYNFTNTYGQPPVTVSYSPPINCSWSHVTLEFSASCYGEQYDRIAAVWLDGSELLRTSTAEPTENGIFWKVHKDVTKYSSLLVQENLTLSTMLENIVNDVFTGVYQVNVTFLYYDLNVVVPSSKLSRKLLNNNIYNKDNLIALNVEDANELSSSGLYADPADLIIPVSGCEDEGFWFRIESESDIHTKSIQIPKNTYKAVLEIYVSFHGNDEFWYKNIPDSYIIENSLSTKRGNGAYREVFVTIDGKFVGSVVPFPVIFTGGINPLFWEPVVGIGAFDLPSYDVDLTPFLALLLDGKVHSFGLGVADGVSYWLADANLHLWLDHFAEEVQAGYVETRAPSFEIERTVEFEGIDGKFEVEMERKREFSGWVNSSAGNVTTHVKHELEFENKIKISKNGVEEKIEQKVKEKIEVKFESGDLKSTWKLEKEYPLKIDITTLPGGGEGGGTYTMTTNLENSYEEEEESNTGGSSKLKNNQQASGWMSVKGCEVVAGQATTNQNYAYKGVSGCYSRVVAAANGTLLSDSTSLLCSSSH